MTSAWQGNAFQPNAFQMGSDGAPPPADQNALISDGNETIAILHEQGQNTDHLGTVSEYQPPELCQAPAVRSVSSYTSDGATATSHNIPLPSGYQAGDRLWGVIISFTSASVISIPAGWNTSNGTGSGTIPSFALWRDADGTEGANLTINMSPAGSLYGFFYAVKGGTFDPYVAPFAGAALQETTTTPNPPSTTTTFGEAYSLFINTLTFVTAARNVTAFPSNCSDWPTSVLIPSTSSTAIASSSVQALAATYDPTNFTINASGTVVTRVHAIKGSCFPAEPLKNHIQLDEQDFTDLSDYGYEVDPPIDDNNPEVAPDAIALDDQDFTDTADYGSQTEQAIPDNNPELAPSALDDQDFTDTSEYGFVQNAGDEQDHHLGTGDGLDQQDFTDLSDYGYSVDPLADDFVLREDFILGDGQGLDTQDFTDLSDYGYSVDQLSTDHVDFILGIALDDQDRTDLTDYGTATEQAIPDNDQNFRPDMVALDDQDRTDFTDYGTVVDPLAPDLVEDFALGDGTGLDTQDFTDLSDYGSYTAPLVDDFIAPENFVLGDGQGLDDQDRTDFTDYSYASWLTPEDVTIVVVNGVDITVQVGCFHVYGFGAITDPTTVWTPASNASTTWNQVADPGTPVWTVTPNGSTTWSGISDPANPGWEEDC